MALLDGYEVVSARAVGILHQTGAQVGHPWRSEPVVCTPPWWRPATCTWMVAAGLSIVVRTDRGQRQGIGSPVGYTGGSGVTACMHGIVEVRCRTVTAVRPSLCVGSCESTAGVLANAVIGQQAWWLRGRDRC